MASACPTTHSPILLTDVKVASLKPPTIGREELRDSKVTGLRVRIGATGKKTWIVRARVGEKVLNKKLGTYPALGVAPARIAAEKLLSVLARDGATDTLDRTFGAVSEAWIDKIAKPRNVSWRLQERRLEMHVLPKWRDRKIVEIRRCDVRDLVEGIEGEALPNQVLTLVRTIFRFALSRDWIDASPAEGVAKPNVENTRDRVLNMEEARRAWKASELLGYPFGQYVRLLLLTGQRRTEVASMRWKAVDLGAATWTLSAEETKSSRAHLVPLSPAACAILAKAPQFGDYAFTTDGKSHMSGYAKVKRRLDEYIAADGGEPMEPWRFHDLRRTVATHLGRLRIREEVIGRVLNHAAQGVTARVYALHHYEPEMREALDAWARELVGEI